MCPFLHFFHDAGLRIGFFFVPFWLRIFEIFIESIQYDNENIPKYFKNPEPKRDKKRNNQEAATGGGRRHERNAIGDKIDQF